MSYTNVEHNKLYYNFLQRTEDFLDLCIEYDVAILYSLFDNGFSTYSLKNKQSIIQKIFIIDSFIENDISISKTFKIMNELDQDLQVINELDQDLQYSSSIFLHQFENYIQWFSKLTIQSNLLVDK